MDGLYGWMLSYGLYGLNALVEKLFRGVED